MRQRGYRATRSPRGGRRGATTTEYAIILFIVAVVGATGFRVFGAKLQGGVGKAESNLVSSNDTPGQAPGGGGGETSFGGGGSAATRSGAGGGGANEGFGGARAPTTATEGTPYAKFALIALCIIGGAAAFFAAMKGKHAR